MKNLFEYCHHELAGSFLTFFSVRVSVTTSESGWNFVCLAIDP
jgi:hypothetical protein